MRLTEHFSLAEFTRSETATRRGLDNTPSPEIIERLRGTAARMEEVRELLGESPIHILSGFRSRKVNAAVGGSATSQHCFGEACDFVAPEFGDPLEICRAIRDSEIDFDQLIFEGEWVHISFADNPRRKILTAHFSNGKTTYTEGVA